MRVIGCVSLVVMGAFVACGGTTQSNVAGPSPDAGTTIGDGGVVTSDAATDASETPGSDVYPAPHHPLPLLKNLGGPVLKDVKIITVTYTGEPQRDALRQFDDAIVAGDWWKAVTDGFGINPGTSGGYVELDPGPVENKTLDNDNDLKPYLRSLVASGHLPPPDANTLYALYFPDSTTIALGKDVSCTTFGAYHDSATFPLEAGTVEAAFAVIPNCGGGRTVSASHEFIEAATDPHPQTMTTWYAYHDGWFGAGGGEAADLCETEPSTRDANGYGVARSWINGNALASKNPCAPTDPKLIYFNAAVDTNESFTVHDPTGGPDYVSEGYVSIAPGASKTLNVDVFSEAKLPHDLKLVVGAVPPYQRRSADPTKLDPIGTGVTPKLSRTTARNGTKVTLTLDVAATAQKGDYAFVVRAILEKNDYHQWGVVLRVM